MRLLSFAVDTSCIRTALCATAIVATGLQLDARAEAQRADPNAKPASSTPAAAANTPTSTPSGSTSSVDADPARAGIKLERVVATGDGCPSGSYSAKLSDNGDLFSIQFNKFRPRITPENQTAATSCRLAIVVNAPVGTSYQVEQVSFSGYGYLEEGVKATVSTTYYFQADQSKAEQLQSTFTGPYDKAYTFDDKASEGTLWSPCGTTTSNTLNVQLHIGLTNTSPGRDGTFELNEAVGLSLRWRTCQVAKPATPAKPTTPTTPSKPDSDDDSDEDHQWDEDSDNDEHRWSDDDDDSDEWWSWSKSTPFGTIFAAGWKKS